MGVTQQIRGVCPVLAVPFNSIGDVDYESFRNLVQFNARNGVESVMIFGVASENAKLTDAEREKLLTILVEEKHASGLIVIATVADHSLELASKKARKFEEIGADFINILPPTFLSPTREQILEHIRGILESVSIPVIIQHLPQAGGMEDVAVLAELCHQFPNLSMIKCEARVREISDGKVGTLIGWGGIAWGAGTAAGAVGVQPGSAVVDLYKWAQRALDRGDVTEFDKRLATFIPWITLWIANVELLVAIEKEILFRRGVISTNYCRRPTTGWDSTLDKTIDEAIAFIGSGDFSG
jgi:2-keto-3-deoxy-L-arabinonate dehydratase